MATYIYETIPQQAGQPPVRFEVQQSMKDAPLTLHPETGEPVRRVVSGGYGFYGASVEKAVPPPPPCGAQCGCFGQN
ncbi:MAG TPA: zinc ribbon domain-containing protein [Opitutaceae bacterium]